MWRQVGNTRAKDLKLRLTVPKAEKHISDFVFIYKMEGNPVLYQIFRHAQSSLEDSQEKEQNQSGTVAAIANKLVQIPYVSGVVKWLSPRPCAQAGLKLPLVSPSGKYVAVLYQATVTILSSVDSFKEPIGICKGASQVEAFVHGAWLQELDMVVVVSSHRSLHFLSVSGQEVDSLLLPNWKGNAAIAGVFARRSSTGEGYEVVVLTADGILHHTLKSDKYEAATLTDIHWSAKKHHLAGVSAFHFHADHSVLVLVGSLQAQHNKSSAGGYSVSVWSLSSAKPELLSSNLAAQQGGHGFLQWSSTNSSPASKPLVRLSPNANRLVVIDGSGRLHLLTAKQGNMEEVRLGQDRKADSIQANKSGHVDVVEDVEWWSEEAVVVARRDGTVNVLLLPSLVTLLIETPPPFSPGCHLAQGVNNQTFVLDNLLNVEGTDPGEVTDADSKSTLLSKQLKLVKGWRLSSLVERSKEEMFHIMIKDGDYAAALQLACKFGLDMDEVYKARWAMSDYGRVSLHENLDKLQDRKWVVKECLTRVCSTQEAMYSLLVYGLMETEPYVRGGVSGSDEVVWWFCIQRLRLLQHKDRLETFLGIHNGRFFPREFSFFRSASLQKVALEYAEGGRIGALDLLFKRHRYSLAPYVLNILETVPETLSPQSYLKLLPEPTPPKAFLARGEEDIVESKKILEAIRRGAYTLEDEVHEVSLEASTEYMVKLAQGFLWPSGPQISDWYRVRARTIDRVSGQLDNSLSLLDLGQRKGVTGLDRLLVDVSDLIKVVLSSDRSDDSDLELSLDEWEQLSEYEKFQRMLLGAQPDSVVDRLREQALPFLHRYRHSSPQSDGQAAGSSWLGTWLRSMAEQNKLELCAAIFEEASSDPSGLFENESEMVDVVVDCIYECPTLDKWALMKSILSRFAPNLDSPHKDAVGGQSEDLPIRGRLRKGIVSRFSRSKPPASVEADDASHRASLNMGNLKLRQAEARVEAGELLSSYQVGMPMKFLANSEEDVNGVKQLLRRLLSKFLRRQPGRLDSEWVALWRDLCTLQEKAFPFLDKEYLLTEFCRGLLQSGKFSVAKNYLKGTSSMSLPADKAEKLVLDAASDFFYSASSIDSPVIDMARQCLHLVPESEAVTAEENMIEAVTVKLPMFGVTLLPLEFRQVRDSMDVVRMVLSAHADAYLNLPEVMEVAMLLGLKSPNDMATVEAAIAREAAAAGDFELARDLCLGLVKKGHGAIWDLCAALARGPEMKNIDLKSRKALLGFALAHCDEDSVGDLLVAWKDTDLLHECHKLGLPIATQTDQEDLLTSFVSGLKDSGHGERATLLREGQTSLSRVTSASQPSWDLLAAEHRKLAGFACFQLPWLLKSSCSIDLRDAHGRDETCCLLARECSNPISFATALIIYGLASYDLLWSDHLLLKLAHEALRSASKENDKVGCGYLMNLEDAHLGAEVLEQAVGRRHVFEDSVQAMHMARLYAALQDASLSSDRPTERRELLLCSFSSLSGPGSQATESSRWTHRRVRTEEKLREMGQVRTLERMIPGADFGRFADGDRDYIQQRILDLVGPLAKRPILAEVLALADQYNVDKWQVLMRQLETLFQSEVGAEDELASFLQQHGEELLQRPQAVLDGLNPSVYSALDGTNKRRLFYFFQFIADCSSALAKPGYAEQEKSAYWRMIASECLEASNMVEGLDFKHIAGVASLNHTLAMQEILLHADKVNVSWLASMADQLRRFAAGGYFPSSEEVYMAFVCKELGSSSADGSYNELAFDKQVETIGSLEVRYNACYQYLDHLSARDVLRVIETLLVKSVSVNRNSEGAECRFESLKLLLGLWTRAFGDAEKSLRARGQVYEGQRSWETVKALQACCRVFLQLVKEKRVGSEQGWQVVYGIAHIGVVIECVDGGVKFLNGMVSAGCSLRAVLAVVDSLLAEQLEVVSGDRKHVDSIDAVEMKYLSSQGLNVRGSESQDTGATTTSRAKGRDILEIYLQFVDSALTDMREGNGQERLIAVLTSLGKRRELSIDDIGDLDEREPEVRQRVWQQLSGFAHDLQVPLRLRISVLELQEACRMSKLEGSDGLPVSWGDWDSGAPEQVGGSGEGEILQSMSDLAALKSTEVVSPLWPRKQVTSEDLATVEAATVLFDDLLAHASSREHVLALRSLLGEWDTLFEPKLMLRSSEVSDGWKEVQEEGWGEGWEECSVETVVHALHACWARTLQRLAVVGYMTEALQVLDGALAHPSWALITQDEAQELVLTVGAYSARSGLKLALLLPYNPPQTAALSLVEEVLKRRSHFSLHENSQVGDSAESGERTNSFSEGCVDQEVVGLLLSSGLLPMVATDGNLAQVFAALCEALGPLAEQLQDYQLERQSRLLPGCRRVEESIPPPYVISFPLFVAELARAKYYPAAGALVLQYMRVPPALATWNAAYAALKQYLQVQIEVDAELVHAFTSCSYLPHTMQHLSNLLKEVPRAALDLLTMDSS